MNKAEGVRKKVGQKKNEKWPSNNNERERINETRKEKYETGRINAEERTRKN